MASRDNAQLILQVDAQIAAAQRSLNQLARSVEQDSSKMEASLNKVAQAPKRMADTMHANHARMRAGFTQLSFQIGDVTQQMALGTRASTIFAQQSGQVIQALQIMGGEGNKFLRFLAGPWGIALATAGVVLANFGSLLFKSGEGIDDLVDKMRKQAKQAALNKMADDAWRQTIDGLTEAIRKRREEQQKAMQTDIEAEQDSLRQAQIDLETLKRQRAAAKRELDEAQRTLSVLRANESNVDPSAIANAEAKVKAIQSVMNSIQLSIFKAEQSIRAAEAVIGQREVEGRIDKVKAATDDYNRALAELNQERIAGNISQDEYNKRLEVAKRKLEAVKDETKETVKEMVKLQLAASGTITGKIGDKRKGHIHAGLDIAGNIGDPIRAPGPGTVKVGNDPNGYGIFIRIEHGQGTVSTLGHLSKVLVKPGDFVEQGQLIGEMGSTGSSSGPHVHQETRVGGKVVDPRTTMVPIDRAGRSLAASTLAETAAERELRQQNRFEEELERLNRELLRAKQDLVEGIDAEADAQIEMVQFEADRKKLAIENDVQEGAITAANGQILKEKVDQIAAERTKNINLQRQLAHMAQQDEIEQRQLQYRIDDMRWADEMATTQSEHRRLQLQILDIVYQQKEAHLRSLYAQLILAKKYEEAARVQEQIDRLPIEKSQDRGRVINGTMNPLEAWAKTIPQTKEEIIEAMQEIEVRGLESLAAAITDVITGARSLGDAFSDVARQIIADIIQMTVRMLIFRAVSAALGGALGGGMGGLSELGSIPGGSLGGSELGWLLGSAKGNVFSHGNLVPFARGGIIGGPMLFPLNDGKTGLAGEAGPEAIMPLTRDASGNLAVHATKTAANSNGHDVIDLVIHSAPSKEAWAKVEAISINTTGRAANKIVRVSVNETLRAVAPKLMGGR